MQSLSASLLCFGFRKNSFLKGLLTCTFILLLLMVIEFFWFALLWLRIREKIHTKAVVDMFRGGGTILWSQLDMMNWWWWWIVFVVCLSDGRHLALFPVGTIVRSSPSRISDMSQAWFEPAQNQNSDFVEWSCALVVIATASFILVPEIPEELVVNNNLPIHSG